MLVTSIRESFHPHENIEMQLANDFLICHLSLIDTKSPEIPAIGRTKPSASYIFSFFGDR